MNEHQKIVVTGGAGFIGSHLTDHLLSLGYRVTVLDNLSNGRKENLSEAVYKAAGEKDMPLVVFFDRIDAYELPLGHIVRGRYALFEGNVDEAKLQLANAQRVKSDLYEAYLLKAEIEMKAGSLATAKTILISLSSDLGAAAWIREMAGELLTTIQ